MRHPTPVAQTGSYMRLLPAFPASRLPVLAGRADRDGVTSAPVLTAAYVISARHVRSWRDPPILARPVIGPIQTRALGQERARELRRISRTGRDLFRIRARLNDGSRRRASIAPSGRAEQIRQPSLVQGSRGNEEAAELQRKSTMTALSGGSNGARSNGRQQLVLQLRMGRPLFLACATRVHTSEPHGAKAKV